MKLLVGCFSLMAGMLLLITSLIAANNQEIIISVPGIPGPYCAYGVEKRLLELEGVKEVELLWKEEKIRVVRVSDKQLTIAEVEAAFKSSDYPYKYEIQQ